VADEGGRLVDRLRRDLTEAIRSHDQVRRDTLRLVLAAISTEQTAGRAHELTDEQVSRVLARQARQRQESAQAYEQAGRSELAERERAELAVIEEYLPRELSDAELADIVDEVITRLAGQLPAGPAAMGPAMREASARVGVRAPGARVAAAVRARLGMR
jgi:uncharacterized protein YqeY